MAYLRVGYTWKRLAYHTWQTPIEIKNFAKSFKIFHPYRMKEFLLDENNFNKEVLDFFTALRFKLPVTEKKDPAKMDRKDLLNYALYTNPMRIKDFEELINHKH